MPRPPTDLRDEFAEIYEGFQLYVEDSSLWSEITAMAKLFDVVTFLRWAQADPDVGDPFADEQARDRAVGFYKRVLFQRGLRPNTVNRILETLAYLYDWWGLGAHQVPLLARATSTPRIPPQPPSPPSPPPPPPQPRPQPPPRPQQVASDPAPPPVPPLSTLALSGQAKTALTWLQRPGARLEQRDREYVIAENGHLPVTCRGQVVRELIDAGVIGSDLSPTAAARQLGLGQPKTEPDSFAGKR